VVDGWCHRDSEQNRRLFKCSNPVSQFLQICGGWFLLSLLLQKLNPAACKMEKFFDYTTGDSAVWCRVLFTLDRLVAVLIPLYTGRVCGRRASARIYVVIACIAAVAKNAHVLATRGAEYATKSFCINGTLHHQVVLDDVCGRPNDEYKVSRPIRETKRISNRQLILYNLSVHTFGRLMENLYQSGRKTQHVYAYLNFDSIGQEKQSQFNNKQKAFLRNRIF